MKSNNINVAAVIPLIGNLDDSHDKKTLFEQTVHDLKNSEFISNIYCLSENEGIAKSMKINWLNRKLIKNADSIGLNKLLMHALTMIEENEDFPDNILYVNYDYINRPKNIIDELINDALYKGCDSSFIGLVDFGHYWYNNENNEYLQTDPSMKSRDERDPLFKALYGLGCLTVSSLIRKGEMIGGKIGILKISDSKYSIRYIN